jgi:hypothetical protein
MLVALASIAAAAASAPSTTSRPGAATTAPAPIDLSSPRAAAKTLFHGVSIGDRDAVRAAFFTDSAQQEQLAGAMADLIVSGKRLGDAARERFGAAGDAIGRGMLDPADLARLDAAEIKPDGDDRASMDVPGQSRPMSFRRGADRKWRLVVTDLGGASAENISKQTHLVHMMAGAMDESAREIAGGKYKTADAATDAIRARLNEVMVNVNRPATATAPATAPTRATRQPTTP